MPYTHSKVVILTADTDLSDITGTVTGTINGAYTPTWVGERGWMTHANAATAQGLNHCLICKDKTPLEIDQAIAGAAPI